MKPIGVLMLVLVLAAPVWAEEAAGGGKADKDKTITLFNGQDLAGWKLYLPDEKADPAKTWSVKNGVVQCTGNPAGYMRTEKAYENYRLRLQWRFAKKPGNSGVLLHAHEPDQVWPKSIEAQLNHTDAGDFWVIGGAEFKEHADPNNDRVHGRRTVKLEKTSEKPLGEWNQYEIECRGNGIKVYVNGVLQNAATECTITKGFIGLQSEGAPIEFRKIILEPLED